MTTQKTGRSFPVLKPKFSLTLPKNLPSSGTVQSKPPDMMATATAIMKPRSTNNPPKPKEISASKKPFESLRHNYVFAGGHSQKFLDIIEQCKISGRKYVDPDFPPDQLSLCYDPSKIRKDYLKATGWRRATDFENAQLFVEGIEPGDVIQGPLGGALSAMATRSDLLMKLFFERTLNPYGAHEFRFFKNGEWITVIIDDHIPLKNGKPLFSCSKDPTEMWVCLLEKAYAKLHLCYEALDGGSEIYALVDMTGGVPETLDLQSKEIRADIASGRLWEKLVKYQLKGYLLGAARIGSQGSTEADSGRGILYNHAYGILGVTDLDGTKLIKLRNPWGEGEWTGKWSDGSDVWTPSLMKKLNHSCSNDGVFWIELTDFVEEYNKLYVLRLFDYEWKQTNTKGKWAGKSAGGVATHPTWKNNPQFGFTLPQTQDIMITLAQQDAKMTIQQDFKFHIGFLLLKAGDYLVRIQQLTKQIIVSQTVFNNSREVSLKVNNLPAGNYIIVPCTYQPNQECTFYISLMVHGPAAIELRNPADNVPTVTPKGFGGPTAPASLSTAPPVVSGSPKVFSSRGEPLNPWKDKLSEFEMLSLSLEPVPMTPQINSKMEELSHELDNFQSTMSLAELLCGIGKYEDAAKNYEKAMEMADGSKEQLFWNKIAACYFYAGGRDNFQRALNYQFQCWSSSEPECKMIASFNMGIMHMSANDHISALASFSQAETFATHLKRLHVQYECLAHLAFLAKSQSNFGSSFDYMQKKLSVAKEIDEMSILATVHGQMADLMRDWQESLQKQMSYHRQQAQNFNTMSGKNKWFRDPMPPTITLANLNQLPDGQVHEEPPLTDRSTYSVDEEPDYQSRLKSRGGDKPSTPVSKKEGNTSLHSDIVTPSSITIVQTPGTTQVMEAPEDEEYDSDVEKERRFAEEIDEKLKKREEQARKKQAAKGMYY